MFVDTIHPCLNIIKGLLIRQVKGYYHPIGLAVELVRNASETLLPSCVPNFNVELPISFLVLVLNVVQPYHITFNTYQLSFCVHS